MKYVLEMNRYGFMEVVGEFKCPKLLAQAMKTKEERLGKRIQFMISKVRK
jgi:hypothetical protein